MEKDQEKRKCCSAWGSSSAGNVMDALQSNLVNLKSSGLGVLFRIFSSSNYREVDIKIINPTK